MLPRGHNSQKMDLKKVGIIFDFYLGLHVTYIYIYIHTHVYTHCRLGWASIGC